MILTYFPEYFSTCPTGIVYTRGTQSHHCRKRVSCSYVISVVASAPAITGLFGARALVDGMKELSISGSMYRSAPNKTTAQAYQSTTTNACVGFDASRSSSIYGVSTTIRPVSKEALMMIRY